MVYNFNLGIGWASSGVEYAQAYRANLFRKAGIPARFIFTDMFPRENIQHMTENIGFLDSEIMWLYSLRIRRSHLCHIHLESSRRLLRRRIMSSPGMVRYANTFSLEMGISTRYTWWTSQVTVCIEWNMWLMVY